MADHLLSVSEAAKELRVSARRIRQLIEEQEIEARRIGNSWVVPLSEVHRRRRRSPSAGRPFEQENAWRMAALADVVVDEYVGRQEDPWSMQGFLEGQHLAQEELAQCLFDISLFDVHEAIDDPLQLSKLRGALLKAHALSGREELMVGWMHRAMDFLPRPSAARFDTPSVGLGWLECLGSDRANRRLDTRLLRSLRDMLRHWIEHDDEKSIARLQSRFDEVRFLHAHPSLLAKLLTDTELVLSGAHAAARYAIDLVPGASVDAYVGADRADVLLRKYSLQEATSTDGNVLLRYVEELPSPRPQVAPRLCVAADLLEGDDPRSQVAGTRLLEALFAALSLEHLASKWT